MTNQEAYDLIKAHLLTQGVRSMNANRDTCMYRGPNGLKCAIGAIIPDEEYSTEFEGTSVWDLADKVDCLVGLNRNLLADLQYIHDSDNPSSWKEHLEHTARRYDLEP